MAFEIYLPEARIAAQRKLWANRLPIDDLDDAVRVAPERTAFVGRNSALGREIRLTYAELGERVDKIAAGLVELGVGKGDVVAFQLPNWWEFTALFYACNRIGAVANPLMPIFRQRELRFMMGFAEAKVAVVPALWRGFDHAAMMREIRPDLPHLRHVFAVGGAGEESFERAFLDRPSPSEAERRQLATLRPEPDEVVELIYTSGTSGEPKAVMHTANTVLAPARCFIEDIPRDGERRDLHGLALRAPDGVSLRHADAGDARDHDRGARPVVGRRGRADDRARGRHLQHGLDAVRLRHGQPGRGAAPAREPDAQDLGVRRRADPARAGAAGQGRDGPRRAVLLGHDRERRHDHHPQERPAGEGVLDRRPGAAGHAKCAWWTTRSARCRPTPSATCRRAASRISSAT